MKEVLILDAEIKKLFEGGGGGGGGLVFSWWEQSAKVSNWEHSHVSAAPVCKVFGTQKRSLSYSRMKLPLWPHKQREALWTLNKCLVLRSWTALEAKEEMGRYRGPAASSKKLSVHALRPDKPDIVPGSALGKASSSFSRLVHTSRPLDSLIRTRTYRNKKPNLYLRLLKSVREQVFKCTLRHLCWTDFLKKSFETSSNVL